MLLLLVGYGEEIVRGVMRDFPERAGATAVVWHDQLLASGQLAALAKIPERLNLPQGTPSEAAAEIVLHYAESGRGLAQA